MLVSLYVDDLCHNPDMIVAFKEEKKKFQMTDLGLMNYFISNGGSPISGWDIHFSS